MSKTKKKQLEDLNLVDNFLFGIVMSDAEGAQLLGRMILKAALKKEFQSLTIRSEQVIWPSSNILHGIRLDACIEESSAQITPGGGRIYDIEPDLRESDRKISEIMEENRKLRELLQNQNK